MSETAYTVFIDESGEPGIRTVREENQSGASPYMVMGACLARNEDLRELNEVINDITATIGKPIHCNKLNHNQKMYVTKRIAKLDVKFFGIISLKSTLGTYRKSIGNSHFLYYNKCSQYLLEKIGLFMKQHEISADELEIVFEDANMDYAALQNFIVRCQESPHNKNVENLLHIDAYRMRAVSKNSEPLLCLADVVAHSLYKCVEKNDKNYNTPETTYLNEIVGNFFRCTETGRVLDFGIKPIHSLRQVRMDEPIISYFRKL